ncbi:hypothetical protein F4782DRAFT_549612 [Xylaria castorea]|nr:hypothetical protein F4782DRAFT_549612 [Xylaria castorea]
MPGQTDKTDKNPRNGQAESNSSPTKTTQQRIDTWQKHSLSSRSPSERRISSPFSGSRSETPPVPLSRQFHPRIIDISGRPKLDPNDNRENWSRKLPPILEAPEGTINTVSHHEIHPMLLLEPIIPEERTAPYRHQESAIDQLNHRFVRGTDYNMPVRPVDTPQVRSPPPTPVEPMITNGHHQTVNRTFESPPYLQKYYRDRDLQTGTAIHDSGPEFCRQHGVVFSDGCPECAQYINTQR